MAIAGIEQPEILRIDDSLRLRKFDGVYDFALQWYMDEDVVYLVDGVRRTYTMELLTRMYCYLEQAGELYFIEVNEKGRFRPIGDVTFSPKDLPIVIGEAAYRGCGIGKKVIGALISRARALSLKRLSVQEIYDFNEASKRCFEGMGFTAYEKTQKGARYQLLL